MIIATNNQNKLKELKEILNIDLKSLKDKNIEIDVEENGTTFYENAYKKAKEKLQNKIRADKRGSKRLV